ncbi:hypothetical protein [Inquilinus sp. OTU3971]|uniref:hypothetical protein n=1 Tax=Inquilinus sp. OTU3971 TaxID=3043855 RepID=UPI00313C7EBE
MSGFDDEVKGLVKDDAVRLLIKIIYSVYIGCIVLLITLLTVGFGDREAAKYIYPAARILRWSVYLPFVTMFPLAFIWQTYAEFTKRSFPKFFIPALVIIAIFTLVPFAGLLTVELNLKHFAYECAVADASFPEMLKAIFSNETNPGPECPPKPN